MVQVNDTQEKPEPQSHHSRLQSQSDIDPFFLFLPNTFDPKYEKKLQLNLKHWRMHVQAAHIPILGQV